MPYTVADAKRWVAEHHAELILGLMNCPDEVAFMRQPGTIFEDIWCSGCWLGWFLMEEHGASEEQKQQICFAHGQRCFAFEPYQVAVAYLNEWVATHDVPERPGRQLADRINRDVFNPAVSHN